MQYGSYFELLIYLGNMMATIIAIAYAKMFQGHVVRFPIYTSYSAPILSSLFNISNIMNLDNYYMYVGGNISILINFMRPSFNFSVVLVNFESFQKNFFFSFRLPEFVFLYEGY